jgi:anthranilate synthase component 2
MTLLIVDHHDSFVHNLVNWFRSHLTQDILFINCDALDEIEKNFSSLNISGVVYSPGPGHPSEYSKSISFYRNFCTDIPFLGVCLGYQIMLYSYGAHVSQVSNNPIHGNQIHFSKKIKSKFLPSHALKGYFVLYHSLGIETTQDVFKTHFHLLACNGNISMAAEHMIYPHLGVQFHPESFASPNGGILLQGFLRLLNVR